MVNPALSLFLTEWVIIKNNEWKTFSNLPGIVLDFLKISSISVWICTFRAELSNFFIRRFAYCNRCYDVKSFGLRVPLTKYYMDVSNGEVSNYIYQVLSWASVHHLIYLNALFEAESPHEELHFLACETRQVSFR